MARPVEIDDEKLLRVARELFLEKGAGVSTVEIARRAGIAQGSIFRRYKSKVELFRAAMLSQNFPFFSSLQENVEKVGLRRALIETGHQIIELYRKILPVAVMSWSNRGLIGTRKGAVSEIPKPVTAMFDFFRQQMEAGNLRKSDPRVMAAAYIGPCMGYVFGELMGRRPHPVPAKEFVEGYVDLLWAGISPERRRA
jgi:AcrR family transcriptional regulator